jgi:anti-sigma factor RsiW
MHWRARRLLAALPDELLPEQTAARLRLHLGRCEACRAELRALEHSEELLRLLPRALAAAVVTGREGERRLSGLARWTRRGPAPIRRRTVLPGAVSSLLATVCLVLFVGFDQRPRIEAEETEAFNFVLAGSFGQQGSSRASPPRAKASPGSEAVQIAHQQPESYFLPVGVR